MRLSTSFLLYRVNSNLNEDQTITRFFAIVQFLQSLVENGRFCQTRGEIVSRMGGKNVLKIQLQWPTRGHCSILAAAAISDNLARKPQWPKQSFSCIHFGIYLGENMPMAINCSVSVAVNMDDIQAIKMPWPCRLSVAFALAISSRKKRA